MVFSQQYRWALLFAAFLALCSVMVIRQFTVNQGRHAELREAFILLHSRGYRPEADRLYQRLLQEIDKLPDKLLLEDYQRTLTLIDPSQQRPDNLIWKYHWTISNEMEKRSEATLQRALKLARQK